jgi:hypothetical protein
MFIIAQLPLADFRPLVDGGKGRLAIPDWSSDNLDSGFVRGFGKISARNGSALGLGGEHAFADVNNALRFNRVEFRQPGWNRSLPFALWFRRLYYDGQIAGRFEIGFMIPEDDLLNHYKDHPVDPAAIAEAILSTEVRVQSVDGSIRTTSFANCSELLALAYITSTTRTEALRKFPIGDTYGVEVSVGKPMLHIRVPLALEIQTSRDRRYFNARGDLEFFITSARASQIRNNVLVQASAEKVNEETSNERVTRVLFAHLNALLFAHSHFVRTGQLIAGLSERNFLRHAVTKMIDRFSRFSQVDGSLADKEFTEGMKLFAKAYAGRIDELVARLQELSAEWNKPTTLESFSQYSKGMIEMITKTAVKTMIETAAKMK